MKAQFMFAVSANEHPVCVFLIFLEYYFNHNLSEEYVCVFSITVKSV